MDTLETLKNMAEEVKTTVAEAFNASSEEAPSQEQPQEPVVEVQAQPAVVEDRSAYNCPQCKGEGLLDQHTICPMCQGTGKVS